MRELDPNAGPLDFFGAELRRWRTAAEISQEQLGQRLGYSGTLVGKVETGDRAPTRDFAQRCDNALPEAGGLFVRIHALAQRWGGHPSWFAGWLDAERRATSLCWWEPLVVPGLLQTDAYARAILGAGPDTLEDELEQMVSARMERQEILDQPRPLMLLVLLDESVLHRCIGSSKIMHEQLLHLAELAERPRITIQVVPARVGVHAGLLGGFAIANASGASDIVYLETSADGQVAEKPSVVAKVTLRSDALRAVALPSGDSRELIMKVAEDRWTD